MGGSRSLRGVFVAGLTAVLVAGTAGLAAADPHSRSDRPSAPGRAAPASGSPVKVGLITTGGDCEGCGGQDEEPAAQAAVEWLNEKKNGLAGHPMALVVCIDSNDPGKGADCANQMIREGVVAVVIGSNGIIETEWTILHDAGIPVINHSVPNAALLEDAASTFILYDPQAQTVSLPLAVAKRAKAEKVSLIVVDVPTATEVYDDSVERLFRRNDIELEVVPVPLGTPDMTPQAQQIVADNPDGVVMVVGHDQFCIPALNGLRAVGFRGTITTISFCITDAMREAIPSEQVEGMRFGSEAPIGDTTDRSLRQYRRVLKKYGAENVDPDDLPAITVFQAIAALSVGTRGLQGEVTPASVIAALRAMDNEVLPAAGGRVFRCNAEASSTGPAICSVSTLTGTLDARGNTSKYSLDNNEPIGD